MIRIGICADAHTYLKRLKDTVEFMKSVDAVLFAGDILDGFRAIGDYLRVYEQFADYFRQLPFPVYLIPGNHDLKDENGGLGALEEFSIHGKEVDVKGIRIVGYGGGSTFPMSGPDSKMYTKERRYQTDAQELDTLMEEHKEAKVLLLHDIAGLDGVIMKHAPQIVITGHEHRPEHGRWNGIERIGCGPVVPFDEHNYPMIGKSCYSFIEYNERTGELRLGSSVIGKKKLR